MDISEVIKLVDNKSGLHAYIANSDNLTVKCIPFNIPPLDAIAGGGIPCSRISELVGEFSSGKTWIIQQVIKSAQNMGLVPVYYNVENKFDPRWFAKSGVDINNLVVIQGNVGEKVIDSVIELIRKNVGLLVVDSVAALVPLAEAEEDMEQNTIALQARMLSKGFRKIIDPLSESSTAVVIINQLRSGMDKYSPDVYPGGRAQYFYSSLTIQVRRAEWITETKDKEEVRKGFRIECRTVNNKLAPPWQSCSFPFTFSGEVDVIAIICEMARDAGLFERAGAWFTIHNGQRVQGWENVLNFYRGDKEAITDLSQRVAQL